MGRWPPGLKSVVIWMRTDLVAEVVQAPGEPRDEAGVVAALEVISAEVVIVGAVAQHDVGGGEHGGGHRDDGLHRPAALFEAHELGAFERTKSRSSSNSGSCR